MWSATKLCEPWQDGDILTFTVDANWNTIHCLSKVYTVCWYQKTSNVVYINCGSRWDENERDKEERKRSMLTNKRKS